MKAVLVFNASYYVLQFVVPLHFVVALVVVFVPDIIFFLFSVSWAWFWCFDVEVLLIFYCSRVFLLCCGVLLDRVVCSVGVRYSCCFFSVLWDACVENWIFGNGVVI
jgi:hypothetical protein